MTRIEEIGLVVTAAVEGVEFVSEGSYDFTFNKDNSEKWLPHWIKYLPEVKEQWENAIHNGDCVKQCCSCMACWYSEVIVETGSIFAIAIAKGGRQNLIEAFWGFWYGPDSIPETVPGSVEDIIKWIEEKLKL